MKTNTVRYGLYALSTAIGLALLISANMGFFREHEIGLLSYLITSVAGVLCLPPVFILIANKSRLAREDVLKMAAGLWFIGLLLPLVGV